MLYSVYKLAVAICIFSVLLLQFMKNHPLFILSPILFHKYIIQKIFYPIKNNEPIHWKKSNRRSTTRQGVDHNRPNIILIIADDLGFNDLSQPKRNNLYEQDVDNINHHHHNNINRDTDTTTSSATTNSRSTTTKDCSDSNNNNNNIKRIGPGIDTKYINSIRENGISFQQAYAGHATCAPSRAALFTGN